MADTSTRYSLAHLAEGAHRFEDVTRALPAPASPGPAIVILGALLLGGAFFLVRRARSAEFRLEGNIRA